MEAFRRSSRSYGNGDCVEVLCRCREDQVLVRDSKEVALGGDPAVLSFGAQDWRRFVNMIKTSH